MVLTITDVLNDWTQLGVFSYLIPFLLIFAVVFAILEKSKILHSTNGSGDNTTFKPNRPLLAIIAASVGLLSLQFDYVSVFFAEIFPRFGVGLSIFLVFLIFIGFFWRGDDKDGGLKIIGWIVAIGVVVWSLANWDDWRGYTGFGYWFSEYFWALVILAGLVVVIYFVVKDPNNTPGRTL